MRIRARYFGHSSPALTFACQSAAISGTHPKHHKQRNIPDLRRTVDTPLTYSASGSSSASGRLSTKTVIDTIRSSACGFITVTPREARR